MAMDNTVWGDAVAAAIQSIGVAAGTPITPAQLQLVWRAVKGEDITHLVGNAEINDVATTGTVTSGPGAGGATTASGTGSITG